MIKVIQRSTIKVKEISFNYEDYVVDDMANEYVDMIGKYPYLQIGNFVIQTTDTISIDHSSGV